MLMVLELVRGADLQSLSRKYTFTAATLPAWREALLAAGETRLKIRREHLVDEQGCRMKSVIAELAMESELLREPVQHLESAKPFLGWRSKKWAAPARPPQVAFRAPFLLSGPSFTLADGRVPILAMLDRATVTCLGPHIAELATPFEAPGPVRRAVHEQLGGFVEGITCGVRLRCDHGSQFVSDDFQSESTFWASSRRPPMPANPRGMAASSACPRPSRISSSRREISTPSRTSPRPNANSASAPPDLLTGARGHHSFNFAGIDPQWRA